MKPKSITSLHSNPSSMGHVESCVNKQGPPCKAKYSWVINSEEARSAAPPSQLLALQDIPQQNQQHCEQEVEEIKRGIKSANITPDASNIRFSDEVLDEQKHAIRIADEKVALAVQAYELRNLRRTVRNLMLVVLMGMTRRGFLGFAISKFHIMIMHDN
ncbi:PHD finger protein ING1 [Camellia lanceoleosa]|uniref:PHD finger protein ING1 n=1 Tax=Camellia lanceoleosa TaxID=1840588 RepID=A0ACC0IFF7_9ERIC|nr:PHD finger protein ING1 [Camellia lanceoleosa]